VCLFCEFNQPVHPINTTTPTFHPDLTTHQTPQATLAKAMGPPASTPAALAVYCTLGPILIAFLTVTRVTSHPPGLWAAGMDTLLIAGSVLIQGFAAYPIQTLWVQSLGWNMVVSILAACGVCVLVSWLVLPTLASDQVRGRKAGWVGAGSARPPTTHNQPTNHPRPTDPPCTHQPTHPGPPGSLRRPQGRRAVRLPHGGARPLPPRRTAGLRAAGPAAGEQGGGGEALLDKGVAWVFHRSGWFWHEVLNSRRSRCCLRPSHLTTSHTYSHKLHTPASSWPPNSR
jgi:hypothetical protein